MNRLRRMARQSQNALLLTRLIGMFLEDSQVRLVALREAAEQGDEHRLRAVAHSLRGGAATFGAAEIVRICSELEDAPQVWTREDAVSMVSALVAAFARVQTALSRVADDSATPLIVDS